MWSEHELLWCEHETLCCEHEILWCDHKIREYGARNDVMELQDRQDPPTLPNQSHEETFSIREEQQDQAEDMPELEEVHDNPGSEEGAGSSEGERNLLMRDIILLEAAQEIIRLKETVFWFGEVGW